MPELALDNVTVVLSNPPTQTSAAGPRKPAVPVTLAQARSAVSFSILEPSYLPTGVRMISVQTLPAPSEQVFMAFSDNDRGESPTFLAIVQAPISIYQADATGTRHYLVVGDSISDSQVGGRRAAAVTGNPGTDGKATPKLVWEQDGKVFHAFAQNVSEDELLRIAGSVA